MNETLEIAKRLIGNKTGIINGVFEIPSLPEEMGMYQYIARRTRNSCRSWGDGGRDHVGTAVDRERAILSSIGEAVERYALGQYDESNFIFSKYEQVKHKAVCLEDFALFSEQQYQAKDFKIARVSKDVNLNWVQGYSLTRDKPILVPACFVYIPYRFQPGEDHIVWESISTGAAAGLAKERATLSGIYEVVERDSLMIMWFNKLSMPRVDLSTSCNQQIIQILTKISLFNLELTVVNITTDIGIPAFFGILVNKEAREPIVVVGAAARLSPIEGILRTLEEVFQGSMIMKTKLRNPLNIKSFNDIRDTDSHGLLYSKTDLRKQVEFVKASKEVQDVQYLADRSKKSVKEDIETCLRILKEKGLEVIVVDITPPQVGEIGFHVVRVIIPGMIPMNGDHRYPYIGGRRIYEVPEIVGYAKESVTRDKLNLYYPHPLG